MRVKRRAAFGVDYDPQWLAGGHDAGGTGGELWVVEEDVVDAAHDGVDKRALFVRPFARLLTGHPPRVAARSGDLAIECRSELGSDEG